MKIRYKILRYKIFIVVLFVIVASAWYCYKEYNRKNKSLADVSVDLKISALGLLKAFEKESASANKKYLGKILKVDGKIKKIEKDNSDAVVILGDEGNMLSVRCSLDTTYTLKLATYKVGASITLTGVCTGFNQNDLLGSDIILNRCIINQ